MALNFPDTDLTIDALTDQDRIDLALVATHADGIEFSFVHRRVGRARRPWP